MHRAERIGLVIAVIGHAGLFAALSLGWMRDPPEPLPVQPIDVTLGDVIALEATAPQSEVQPAQSVAPEQGVPDDAPAPTEAEDEPEPTPPVPQPKEKPAPKPDDKAAKAPDRKSASTPDKAKDKAAKSAATQAKDKRQQTQDAGSATASSARPRGSRLGPDFLKGIGDTPTDSKSQVAKAATMDAAARASIASAIVRQVQPCADRQVKPGPGAERIRVTIRLRLNRDGSLAARPQITGRDGVDDDNSRYVDAVDRNAIATFTGCSPLRLPEELYDVPNGWSNFSLRYKLPG